MIKKIDLTQNKVAIVDDEDFEWLNKKKWFYGAKGYAVRNSTVDEKKVYKKHMIYMHKEIKSVYNHLNVDHINNNSLDNRKENLRICTSLQNAKNLKIRKDNSTGFKGVVWHKQKRKYQAQISVNRKNIFLGLFDDKIQAAMVYDIWSIFYFGKFAKTNRELGVYND